MENTEYKLKHAEQRKKAEEEAAARLQAEEDEASRVKAEEEVARKKAEEDAATEAAEKRKRVCRALRVLPRVGRPTRRQLCCASAHGCG